MKKASPRKRSRPRCARQTSKKRRCCTRSRFAWREEGPRSPRSFASGQEWIGSWRILSCWFAMYFRNPGLSGHAPTAPSPCPFATRWWRKRKRAEKRSRFFGKSYSAGDSAEKKRRNPPCGRPRRQHSLRDSERRDFGFRHSYAARPTVKRTIGSRWAASFMPSRSASWSKEARTHPASPREVAAR